MKQKPDFRRAALVAALCVCLVFAWQALTVHFNYGGNWTALYCTGEFHPTPPSLASEHIYVFPHSDGWDGQFYHYIAHYVFLRGEMQKYVDAPRLRFRRILVPSLAALLSAGNSSRVDTAYLAVILLFDFWARGASPHWPRCGDGIRHGR